MSQFKKGQMIWVIDSWDGYATVYYRRGIVHSAGKKQMYIQFADEMAKQCFYLNADGSLWGTTKTIVPIDQEPMAIAQERALDIQAKGIATRTANIAEQPKHADFYRAELAKYQTVRVARHEDLLVELHERMNAEVAAKRVVPR